MTAAAVAAAITSAVATASVAAATSPSPTASPATQPPAQISIPTKHGLLVIGSGKDQTIKSTKTFRTPEVIQKM